MCLMESEGHALTGLLEPGSPSASAYRRTFGFCRILQSDKGGRGATMNGMGWARLLRLAAGVLALAALLVVAGQGAQVLSFPGAGARLRLESLSGIANGVSGLLVVGAVMLALVATRMDDAAVIGDGVGGWPLVVGGFLGGVLLIAATYSVIDILTIHIPSPGATGQQFQVSLSSGHAGWERLAVILQRS